MIKTSFYCLIMILLSSCSVAVKKIAQIRNPKVESSNTITNFLNKNNIPLENNYLRKGNQDSTFIYNNLLNGFKNEILIFDKKGIKYCYQGTDKCTGKQLKQAYSNFQNTYKPCEKDSTLLNTVLANFQPLINNSNLKASDYYLIVYWNKYFGSKNKIAEDYTWFQSMKKDSDIDISILFVNTDLQTDWGLIEGEKMKIKFKLKSMKSASIEFGKIPYQ